VLRPTPRGVGYGAVPSICCSDPGPMLSFVLMGDSEDKSFVANAKWYLDQAMTTGLYSAGLIREFDAHAEDGTANIFPIFAEIAALEGAKTLGPSQTKAAAQFSGRWLRGLWHKHYTQAQFMRANLELHWTRDRLIRMFVDSFGARTLSMEQLAKELSQRVVTDGYMERARKAKLTGEWIVFAKQENKAYYLTMATHTEKDEVVWHRCKACAAEFPYLQILQEDRG
jgi:hypothetical protein